MGLIKRTVLGAALVAALSLPAIADPTIHIAFRNPTQVLSNPAVERSALAAMVAAQLYDSVNSGRRDGHGWHENNWQLRPFSHSGPLGFAVGFALWDLAELAVARRLHVHKALVEASQAVESADGILRTNGRR